MARRASHSHHSAAKSRAQAPLAHSRSSAAPPQACAGHPQAPLPYVPARPRRWVARASLQQSRPPPLPLMLAPSSALAQWREPQGDRSCPPVGWIRSPPLIRLYVEHVHTDRNPPSGQSTGRFCGICPQVAIECITLRWIASECGANKAGAARPRYCATRRNTSEALVPPNPNEFESATSICRRRALCGTRSIAVVTEGASRLSVGGTT